MTYRIRTQLCPVCNAVLNAATPVTELGEQVKPPSPVPGDYTVCINCASLLRYGDGLQFETFKLEDVANPDNRRMIGIVIQEARKVRRFKKSWNKATSN